MFENNPYAGQQIAAGNPFQSYEHLHATAIRIAQLTGQAAFVVATGDDRQPHVVTQQVAARSRPARIVLTATPYLQAIGE